MTITSMKIELYRQVHLILNPSIRDFVLDMLSYAPPGFFERPASTQHHLPDERGEGGDLLHTIRVIKVTLILADISTIKGDDKDVLVAGAAIHDLCRRGLNSEFDYSHESHPHLVRRLAENHSLTCDHFHLIMRIVGNHMGQWGSPQFIPHMSMDAVLHVADCIEAHLPEVL